MKKLLALLTALMMLLLPMAAMADKLDLSYVESNIDKLFELDINEESNVAFVDTALSASSRSFVHKYESSYRYSTTEFDVLVVNYASASSNYPILRMWISYCADDEFLYFDSVSFDVDGQIFTFTGVGSSDRRDSDDKGCVERGLIKFDESNIDFLIALENYAPPISQTSSADENDNYPVYMTLHGTEDVTVTLSSGFWLDFFAMREAFLQMNGMEYISRPDGTPMTTK